MGRGAVLLVVAYAGLVLLGALGLRALEGPPRTPDASEWDLATALLFVTTLLTTVGYGGVTPVSASGRAFCAALAALGVPATMLALAGAARRLTGPLVERPRRYLRARWGYSRRGAARAHFLALVGAVLGGLVLLPAAVFDALEETWSYLDAVYFCVISLCTVGLGDLVPARQPRQPWRQLYQLAVAAYLLVGLTGVLLLAQSCHRLARLHGLARAASDEEEEEEEEEEESAGLLEGRKDGEKPARGHWGTLGDTGGHWGATGGALL
ncbi:potassium channel subfamily K member 6-like [Athene noctua]|uniref:potassium channel subfamily K member 6-like n=1 Tax=Athene noctua TaxID=126797 RepID=UPI003EB755FD